MLVLGKFAMATPATFDNQIFQIGASWTWAYSKCLLEDGRCLDPYLYETYTVIDRNDSLVTIEMSSDDHVQGDSPAHHKFVADLDACKKAGTHVGKFLNWKIEFYTTSLSDGWELVSKKFKGLAFTEKFNCFSGKLQNKSKTEVWNSESLDLFQWMGLNIQSWYAANGDFLKGVAVQRTSGHYRVQLQRFQPSQANLFF